MRSVTERIIDYLAAHGPSTGAEIAKDLGRTPKDINSALLRMNKQQKEAPKRVHISAWTWDQEGARSYPRPIYTLGFGQDARKPTLKAKQSHRNYSKKVNYMFRKNFVFNLGLTSRESRLKAWNLNAPSRQD